MLYAVELMSGVPSHFLTLSLFPNNALTTPPQQIDIYFALPPASICVSELRPHFFDLYTTTALIFKELLTKGGGWFWFDHIYFFI